MAVGTGRTLKAAIDHLPPIDCPQHCVVSLTGNIGPDGSAAYYNVIFSMAEAVKARHFPMPLPVFVASPEERALMHGQSLIRSTLALAANADVTFVGIGEMDEAAPLYIDRFLTAEELAAERAAGAVGEICGWIFDREGRLRTEGANLAPRAPRFPTATRSTVIALAKGRRKLPAIRAALTGRPRQRPRHRRGHRRGAARRSLSGGRRAPGAIGRRSRRLDWFPASGPSISDEQQPERTNAPSRSLARRRQPRSCPRACRRRARWCSSSTPARAAPPVRRRTRSSPSSPGATT